MWNVYREINDANVLEIRGPLGAPPWSALPSLQG